MAAGRHTFLGSHTAAGLGRAKGPDRSAVGALRVSQEETRTFSAWGPLGPWARSNSTFWFSSSDL